MTTKGLHHLQMRKKLVREIDNVKPINIKNITGGNNNSVMFTKEDKDDTYFIQCRYSVITSKSDFLTCTIV